MSDAKTRPTRSWLFTPATRPDRFAKAADAGADVLIIDLEDAVAPGDKDRARAGALDYLAGADRGTVACALRINGLETRAGLADLQIDPINEGLTPSLEAVAEARAILAENAKGVGTVGGRMIDEAVARKARRVLAAVGESC